jgi:hypothetical protein
MHEPQDSIAAHPTVRLPLGIEVSWNFLWQVRVGKPTEQKARYDPKQPFA